VLRCKILGHRYRFSRDGETMVWHCQRGCGAGGSKRYATAAQARLFTAAFDRGEHENLGRHAPLGLTPLRLLRAIRSRRHSG
jgi:hypothetical protein